MTNRHPHLRRWQCITCGTLFVGYVGYYICRANLSVATPLILADYADAGMTKANIGSVASVGVALYAIGKVINGLWTVYAGGRKPFLGGMVASVVCTLAFGLSLVIVPPLAAVLNYQ